jgi:hypothetical protein
MGILLFLFLWGLILGLLCLVGRLSGSRLLPRVSLRRLRIAVVKYWLSFIAFIGPGFEVASSRGILASIA